MSVLYISEGWIMVSISSLSCVLGASVVFLGRKVLENSKFLSSSMALGGGVLIFNSLYTLLPASQQKLNNSNFWTFLCFFIGVLFTVILSFIIQSCAPRAIHTCDPTTHIVVAKNNIEEVILESNEEDNTSKPILPYHHHHSRRVDMIEYGTIVVSEEGAEEDEVDNINHSHLHENKADYFLIGIQTAIAICIHKFPEGLIMFISNESSSQLGLNVAAAMIMHNLIEGFLIALPLYYATGSRFAAFMYASFLGGMSQPLGAILGLLVIRNVDYIQEKYLFGIIFGVVSGMMCLIAVQSMLPQAIRTDKSNQCVPLFFFIGILFISLSSLLQSI
ncbi:Zinc/iron permease [Cokeromyces recurvatus]|uniref:Zinc/iron permease n=1 Tax=Cokeromyces recurvatus TaxID=90255 RepID=UPI0022204F0E|nr:Zinc/iron permease [Cokeromyces recurvatus]KAI7907212.1 Zinc/iron permease [Cokeromyces recurvatus]